MNATAAGILPATFALDVIFLLLQIPYCCSSVASEKMHMDGIRLYRKGVSNSRYARVRRCARS